jgi:uncharacterized cupin superfamily protein
LSAYTVKNLREVEDMAPRFGFPPEMQARFAKSSLDLERVGATHFRLEPGFRIPFAHRHENQEEVYVVVSGSARIKVEDEVIELHQWDAIRVSGDSFRNLAAGPEGAEILAFGEGASQDQTEFVQGWWSE